MADDNPFQRWLSSLRRVQQTPPPAEPELAATPPEDPYFAAIFNAQCERRRAANDGDMTGMNYWHDEVQVLVAMGAHGFASLRSGSGRPEFLDMATEAHLLAPPGDDEDDSEVIIEVHWDRATGEVFVWEPEEGTLNEQGYTWSDADTRSVLEGGIAFLDQEEM